LKKLLVLVALLWAVTASAAFPDKPVKIITAMPVGSGPDNVQRKMAEKLSEKWGVPVIVENKPGGSGAVAFSAYDLAPADGYHILVSDPGQMVSYPILYNKPEVLTNLEPSAGVFFTPFVIISATSVKDFAELKVIFKNKPMFSTFAIGTGMHLEGLDLSSYWNIDSTHVAYPNLGLSYVDVSNGLVPFTISTVASSRQLEAGGKIKYIAYGADRRHPDYPNVPTLRELTGNSTTNYHSWNMAYIKKAVPADIKEKIAKDISDVMKTPEMKSHLKTVGYDPLPGTPADLEKFVDSETINFKKAINKYKISVQ
jgi:tripartite-type tricarboxylate transporter receptor subunit TctC